MKNQEAILEKLGIEALNPMQEAALLAVEHSEEVQILSPTGSGKTLAFLLPLIELFNPKKDETQALIVVPSRELAIQIEQVAREMGSGYKILAVYGGQSRRKDLDRLKTAPTLIIGTAGRLADHLEKGNIDAKSIKYLVLDEFDKSLEIGFEEEMQSIMQSLPNLKKKILTSATKSVEIPAFMAIKKAVLVDFLEENNQQLELKRIISPHKDKLQTLFKSICHLGDQSGIIFLNFRDAIQRVSDFLWANNIPHACFHGGMEQRDRERALIQFRNGTYQILLASDLAARGIDIPEIRYIIHYHLPMRAHEFTHRNGRTARMHAEGVAYCLQWEEEELPDFIQKLNPPVETLSEQEVPPLSPWKTLFISGGRQDKISKGDIAGLFFKQGKLKKDELGLIELKEDCAFVAVKKRKAKQAIQLLDNSRLKKKKVRIELI
jgi:superfamily II DNA/RNA helicase